LEKILLDNYRWHVASLDKWPI
jgi:hypothetical protein